MNHKQRKQVTVLVTGQAGTGKTIIQQIISRALKEAGLEVELGLNSQSESSIAAAAGIAESDILEQLREHIDVVVEEIHTFEAIPTDAAEPCRYAHSKDQSRHLIPVVRHPIM